MKNTSKTITGLTLASAVVLSQANISHAQESNNKDKNSEMTQKLNDKDVKIKYADPQLKINTKTQKQADSNKEDRSSNSKKEYSKEPKMDDEVGVYNYGAGDPDSGVNKASKIEQDIDDKDVSINKKNVKAEKSGIAMVMSPLKGDKNTYYAGSAFAVDKHTLLTNDHVAIDQAKKGDFKSVNAKDMIITPNRDSSEEYVPAELKAKDIKLLKSGDVAVIHTKEDLSKYMKINKIASENKIKDEKEKGNITLSGYPGSRNHKDIYGDDYGPKGTPFDMKSKFIMHATNIHPVMYYKGYFEKGMSGSPIYNDEDEVIGIHAGILDTSANGPKKTKADLGYGFSITKDVKKDLDKELQADETKEDETKAKDNNNKDQDNKKDDSKLDSKDDDNKNNVAKAAETKTDESSNNKDEESNSSNDNNSKEDEESSNNQDNDKSTNNHDNVNDDESSESEKDEKDTNQDNNDNSSNEEASQDDNTNEDDETANDDNKSNIDNESSHNEKSYEDDNNKSSSDDEKTNTTSHDDNESKSVKTIDGLDRDVDKDKEDKQRKSDLEKTSKTSNDDEEKPEKSEKELKKYKEEINEKDTNKENNDEKDNSKENNDEKENNKENNKEDNKKQPQKEEKPKEEPKEESKDSPKEEHKEDSKDQPKEESKEDSKDQPKPQNKEKTPNKKPKNKETNPTPKENKGDNPQPSQNTPQNNPKPKHSHIVPKNLPSTGSDFCDLSIYGGALAAVLGGSLLLMRYLKNRKEDH